MSEKSWKREEGAGDYLVGRTEEKCPLPRVECMQLTYLNIQLKPYSIASRLFYYMSICWQCHTASFYYPCSLAAGPNVVIKFVWGSMPSFSAN
jgi:hypothetical protein